MSVIFSTGLARHPRFKLLDQCHLRLRLSRSFQYPEKDMAAHQVNTLVNNPKFDDPRCIEPVK